MKAKPAAAKGKYLRTITVATTIGPGMPVDVERVSNLYKKKKGTTCRPQKRRRRSWR